MLVIILWFIVNSS